MNLRERLAEAYENVLFCGDETWTNHPDAYHKSNMDLYLTERDFLRRKFNRQRPRTVRESIPGSRLAQYSNYFYNESREMSYASSSSSTPEVAWTPQLPSEPWELHEAAELYRKFLKNEPEDKFSRIGAYCESSLLSVSNFEEKMLKMLITEDRIKGIWRDTKAKKGNSGRAIVELSTTPISTYVLSPKGSRANHNWFRNRSTINDIGRLESLTTALKNEFQTTPPCPEMLYSEVLQGGCSFRKPPPRPTTYIQQTMFYSHVQTVHRWLPTACYPAQIVVSNWVRQSQVLPHLNRSIPRPGCPQQEEEDRERPVCATSSEELEIQAIEQYSTVLYQELEEEAIKQYNDTLDKF